MESTTAATNGRVAESMDWSKLSANEKMAVYASAVLVVAGIISNWGGLLWLSIIAALAVLVVVFLPQFSPSTSLPGSKGSLLLILGGIAAVGAVIEILRYLGYFFATLDDYQTWLFAVALVASLVLLWTAWQEFQGEGGKFTIGTASGGTTPAAGPPPPAEAPAAPPPAAPPPVETPEPMAERPSMAEPPSMSQPSGMEQPTQPRESTESDEDRSR
jgi:hypothetical protein